MPHVTKAPTEELIRLYMDGFSCQSIAESYSMSRQAVWERLKRANVELRSKVLLPFIMYDGIKFTVSKSTGYYRNTDRTSRGYAISLHRYKYVREKENIPIDWDVHHIDLNRQNNDIENLLALPKAEHTKLHHRIRNENTNV